MEGVAPVIHEGQAKVRREYLFVKDAADAYLAIARSISEADGEEIPDTGEDAYSHCVYNVGANERAVKTTVEVISDIAELMESKILPVERARPWSSYIELPEQYLNSVKILRDLGWKARTEFLDGLRKSIEWYRDHQEAVKHLYQAEIRK